LPFLPENIEAAVDDTLCHRTGPHIFGAAMHHDSATSTDGGGGGRRAGFAFGHNMLAALRREFWGARMNRHPTLRPHRAKIIRLIESLTTAA